MSSLPLRALSAFVAILCAVAAVAAPDPTYTALRNARPDGRTVPLQNFVFERDVVRFTLTGTLHLLQPVDGKTTGAVFIGQGAYALEPATPAEQRQLAIHADDDGLTVLSDSFESAVFLGIALPAAATKSAAPASGSPNATATERWNDYMNVQRKNLHWNMQVRLLQDIVDAPAEPYFAAWLNGRKHPPAFLQVDPVDAEQTSLLAVSETKGGVWYSSRYKSEIAKGVAPVRKPAVDVDDYVIDTTIKGAEIDASTTMTFTVNSDVRVLPLNLMGRLRITEAAWSPAFDEPQWTPITFIQEERDEDPTAAVVFPSALKKDEMHLLRITYGGPDALTDAGEGNFTVGARTSWYPNVAVFDDLAMYELRFRVPQKLTVVAVGKETESKVEGDQRVSVWKTTDPVRVAGFNLGKFKKIEQTDKDSGMTVTVYTNPGTPDIIRTINDYLSGGDRMSHSSFDVTEVAESRTYSGPTVRVDTASLAQSAMADGINTARTGNEYFGALQTKNVAFTQQSQWFFGQSWPSLIYLPYLSFMNSTTRHMLGLAGAGDFVDKVAPHEFAHQWWGHQIGHKTYRDQWLDEGFAEFTAALVSQQTGGWGAYNGFFENARRLILDKPTGSAVSNDQAGPITQGYRLSTWKNPWAPNVILYSKGAYVLHMLRMAMWHPKTGDTAFKAMMREYVSTYSGRNPSTLDFQRIAEKHATPNLKLTTDGKLDWFFNQWVHGTAIPKLTATLEHQSVGDGKYKVTGSVTQSEVPGYFANNVPIYVQIDKNTIVRFAAVMIVGSTTRPVELEIALPKKPQKFLINVNHDILTR